MNSNRLCDGLALSCLSLLATVLACDGGRTIGSHEPPTLEATSAIDEIAPDDGLAAASVADVTVEIVADEALDDQPAPAGNAITARIRNEGTIRVDVTLRFVREDVVVHLAYLEVMPQTVTTVVSPEPADVVEVSGVDENGVAIPSQTFVFGVDFDEHNAAVYSVAPEATPANDGAENDAGASSTGADEDSSETAAETNAAPTTATISLLAPPADVTYALGSVVRAKWTDSGGSSDAILTVGLRPAGSATGDDYVPLSPQIAVASDGINDEIEFVVQNVSPGLYDVAAELVDGGSTVWAVAPGRINVVNDAQNSQPSLSILAPNAYAEFVNGDILSLAWADADADDNANIQFSLETSTDVGALTYMLGPPFSEDPDGPSEDAADLVISDVLPGTYDLVGTIDDGHLAATIRLTALIGILPDPVNSPPSIELIQPDANIEVDVNGAFLVGWIDADENDNAMIAIALDPDLDKTVADGDEILLVAAVGEDEDGPGDYIMLGIPEGVALGTYRVMAVITDGVTEVVAFAPGQIEVASLSPPQDDPVPSVVVVEPSKDEFQQLSDVITAVLEIENVPYGTTAEFYVDNTAFGGSVANKLDLLSIDPATGTVELSAVNAMIPNDAWPRMFALEAEVIVDDKSYSDIAPGAVWIRQELVVLDAQVINNPCFVPPPLAGDFVGLQFSWYGGGFGVEDETEAGVTFWLAGDGLIPAEGANDESHLLILETTRSPGVVRVNWIEHDAITGLDSGTYRLVAAVAADELVNHVETSIYPEAFDLCFGLSDSDDFDGPLEEGDEHPGPPDFSP